MKPEVFLNVTLVRHYQFESPGYMIVRETLSCMTVIMTLNGALPTFLTADLLGVVVNHDRNINSGKMFK